MVHEAILVCLVIITAQRDVECLEHLGTDTDGAEQSVHRNLMPSLGQCAYNVDARILFTFYSFVVESIHRDCHLVVIFVVVVGFPIGHGHHLSANIRFFGNPKRF